MSEQSAKQNTASGAAKKQRKTRLIVQALFAALSNGYLNGWMQGTIYQGASKKICVPGLNCYSCPGALGACPIGSLQAVLSDKSYHISLYVVGMLMAFGAFFGRFICGWLCPFGLVQDLLYMIPGMKKIRSLPGEKYLRKLKYVVLVLLVIILPSIVTGAGDGEPWFCKYLCPSGTLMGGIPLMISNPLLRQAAGWLFSWKMLVLVIILVMAVKISRPFCRYLCPLGAIYSFFNPFSIYRITVDKEKCTGCGICQKTCKLDIPVFEKPNSGECIRCGECVKACPAQALKAGFGTGAQNKKISKPDNEV